MLSDLSSSDEDAPQIKVPLSKDEALAAVQRSKVLKGLSIHGQVRVAALLRRCSYQPGERLWSGQEGDEKRLVLIESGEAELWLPEGDGERFVGTCGPRKVLGGLFAVGSASRQIFSVRVPDLEEAKVLHAWEIDSRDLEQFESLFNASDLTAFRRRVLQDVRIQVIPYLQRQLACGGVFSRYSTLFIGQLVKDMDLRLFEPGQVIFKEKSLGRSLGILVSGSVDVIANGRKVFSKSNSGQEIGEAALFETGYRRHATTRCSQHGETLMFLATRDAFYACLAKFPEEKIKLAEQVRHRIAMTVMKEPFSMCDSAFLHLVCTECEVVQLAWPKAAIVPGQEEVMHLCYAGDLVVETESEQVTSRFAKKWEMFGLKAALGLHSGPADYKLMAGRQGCTLVRVTWKAVEQALMFFPDQLPQLLELAGLKEVPPNHPFKGKETLVWDIIQPLLCRVFCTLEIDAEFCASLAQNFQAAVYDAGCLIAPEGVANDAVLLLISGEVTWSRQGIVTFDALAPDYFDEFCLFAERHHAASLTAKSTAVIWRLHRSKLSHADTPGSRAAHAQTRAQHVPSTEACRRVEQMTEEMQELTQEIHGKLRSNMRNMKTWRRFNSEVLGLLSDNIFLRTFLPGQCIFSDGDTGEFIFILMRGRVEVQSQGKTSFLEEGVTFGEMVLFGQTHRSATITACCLCIINAVHKDLVSHALRAQPRKAFLVDHKKAKSQPSRVRGTEDKALRRTPKFFWQEAQEEVVDLAVTQAPSQRLMAPRQCQKRLERSFLLEARTPRLPPVETLLYKAPKVTEMKLRVAFQRLMPRHVLVASANMRGVREGYVHKAKQLGLDDSLPSVRVARATYTEPVKQSKRVKQARRRKLKPKRAETEDDLDDLTVVGGLQVLAASLLRLSSKPSIATLLDTNPHRPRMPPRAEPLRQKLPRLSRYAESLARSERAYGSRERSPQPEVLPASEEPDPGRDAENAALEERADAAALNLVVRRLAYESYEVRMARAQCLAILLSPMETSDALLQLEMHLHWDAESSGTVRSASVVEHDSPGQVSPSSSFVPSLAAEDLMSHALQSLFDL